MALGRLQGLVGGHRTGLTLTQLTKCSRWQKSV